ncbi:MAG: enoyl-CoA hydratase/isomerase family protein, partial [Spongiibacteraceae bacterium]
SLFDRIRRTPLTDYKNITLSVQDKIATLTLNRPEQLNALSPDLFAEAVHALEGIALSKDIGVVILAANGRAFCAGADLKVFTKPDFTKEQATEYTRNADRFATLLETMPQATIAKVHGICFTGGLEVSLGCDFMICADEARFADTHAKLGFVPMWGLSQRLPRRVGLQRAREMSFTAREYSGKEAVEIGLALKSVPLAELAACVQQLAGDILKTNARSVATYKKMYWESQNSFLKDGIQYEIQRKYKNKS